MISDYAATINVKKELLLNKSTDKMVLQFKGSVQDRLLTF
jgi:hypothetical protein